MAFRFLTKAKNLEQLDKCLSSATIPALKIISLKNWQEDRQKILNNIKDSVPCPWIVRSSASGEDSMSQSKAGCYDSVLNVTSENFFDAVQKVILSYGADWQNEEVLVQEQVSDVKLAGVAFTADPSLNSPYYVINYDDSGLSTSSVTSGTTNDLKTFVVFKGTKDLSAFPTSIQRIVGLLRELEVQCNFPYLDVEFAIKRDESLVLFQVRPILVDGWDISLEKSLANELSQLEKNIKNSMKPHPFLFGEKTIFGVMPDWNPAEIIGLRPRPLSLSLYKELVTDAIWAYQRDNYGYRNLRSFPLLMSFAGMPYIDVRIDFNSFVPADVPSELAKKLVEYYLFRLEGNPNHHDKVEFEIVYSCLTFNLEKKMMALLEAGFTQDEIQTLVSSLRNLTNRIVDPISGLWRKDAAKIEILEQRRKVVLESSMNHIEKIYWLLEDCKRYGTLPFAGLARAAFISVQILKSLVEDNVLTQTDYDSFMGSLQTVSSQLGEDFKSLDKVSFLNKYGHLRPGTYDILSKRYDEEADIYFDWNQERSSQVEDSNFALSLRQLNDIEVKLKEHGLNFTSLGLFDFLKSAIEGREYSKFVFSRNISDVLSLLGELGVEHGLSLEEMSYADIQVIYRLKSSTKNIKTEILKSIESGKSQHNTTSKLLLPPLITSADQVWGFEYPQSEPNFITSKRVKAPVQILEKGKDLIRGSVLFIQSADPGYDWIFSNEIAGFVTMYGGVNSHMAIRASELGIPAIIGAGEALFKTWSLAKSLDIDCYNRQVRVLK